MSQFQKQPPDMFYRKRKTPVLESPFNRFVGFKTCNFLKKGLQHRKIPVLVSLFKKVAGLEARKSIKRRILQKFLRTLFWRKSANNCFCNSCFLLLIFVFGCLLLLLIQQTFFKGPLQGLKSSSQGAQWQTSLLFEKKKNQSK